ncbi:DUF3488 domain-containing protein [Candidatus Peregrinibacteria bacterium]|nr:MAG: DUF3488 domain-containing protein [Candidatus Peregrinibacteria bacterium]
MFARLNRWLSVSGALSKTGAVLLGLGILLMFISFAKGIQVLMFLPAFVLSLFLFSFWETWVLRKKISVFWTQEGNEKLLFIRFLHPNIFSGISLLVSRGNKKNILTPTASLEYEIEKEDKITLLIQGRLDIFRLRIPVPPFSSPEDAGVHLFLRRPEEELYFHIRPLQDGEEFRHIDALRSAKTDSWFVREMIPSPLEKPKRKEKTEGNTFRLSGNVPLWQWKSVRGVITVEWLLILVGVLGAQWESRLWSFTISAIISILTVLFFTKRGELSRGGIREMNGTALFLFFLCFAEGGIRDDTVIAGVHFLLLLAIWKHLFPRQRRDMLTYIFLILFVFVAFSLYSLEAWFFFLFLLFLILAVLLFSLSAAGEVPSEYNRFVMPRRRRRDMVSLVGGVLLLTFTLFFFLPHGTRTKDTSLIEKTTKETKTGFDEEVDLQNIRSIKEDYSKKIVIEGISENDQKALQNLLWRGARYEIFDGKSWRKKEGSLRPFLSQKESNSDTLFEWNVRYYHKSGEKALFTPIRPVSIIGARANTFAEDSTLINFLRPLYSSAETKLLLKNKNGIPIEAEFPIFISEEKKLSPSVRNLFQPFWETIPKDIQSDPVLITRYIRDDAGFSYSLANTASSLKDFLYGSRRGHCEYFATVLTLTLQEFGYSATFVNGYRGGEYNNTANAWIIRGIHAHSWTEVFDKENGWIQLDATPISEETVTWLHQRGFWGTMVRWYDTIELRWFEYIVSYTGERQKAFLKTLSENKAFFFWGIAGICFVFLGRRWYPKVRKHLLLTPREQFFLWLSRKSQAKSFLLESLQESFPELVAHTRKELFRKNPNTKDIRELKKRWLLALREKK